MTLCARPIRVRWFCPRVAALLLPVSSGVAGVAVDAVDAAVADAAADVVVVVVAVVAIVWLVRLVRSRLRLVVAVGGLAAALAVPVLLPLWLLPVA